MATPFKIHYAKTSPLTLKPLEESFVPTEEEFRYQYNPFRIGDVQNYNPTYSEFFVMNDKNYGRIAFNNKYHIKDINTVVNHESKTEHKRPIFIKYSPLLDPLRFMIGKYDLTDAKTRTLPNLENETLPKLSSYHNTSYVDNFFCYLNSQLLNHHAAPNCMDYYGSFLGIQERFKMNLVDDLEYVSSSTFFKENLGKRFVVNHESHHDYKNFGSRGHKLKLQIETDVLEIDAICLEDEVLADQETQENYNSVSSRNPITEKGKELEGAGGGELVYENAKVEGGRDDSSSSASSNSSNNSEINYSSSDEDEDEDDCSSGSEWETESSGSAECSQDEDYIAAYINDFPVQMICLEKCDGTLDELFMKNEINEENGSAVMMQIIMTLLLFQKCFRFTHNDLHTNNVMYVNTDLDFLYYKFENQIYKVPTFGKIFKIIDFGRAIYKFQGRTFCSDSFAPGGDAATQYNCEPFFNNKKARLEPNFSFDLSRLGTSIYDFVVNDDENENLDEFQKTIKRWCTDDNGKNILYKKNGEDRYPNFKLYKMISRTVHEHTPENQLKFKYFSQYRLKSRVDVSTQVLDIDSIPTYI